MRVCLYGDKGKSSIMKHLMGYSFDDDIFEFSDVIIGIQYSDMYAIQFKLHNEFDYYSFEIDSRFIESFGDDFISLSTYKKDISFLIGECYRLLSEVAGIYELFIYAPFTPDVKMKFGYNLIIEIPSSLSIDMVSLYLGSADRIILTRNVLEDYSTFDEVYMYRYRTKLIIALTLTDCVSFININSLYINSFFLKLPTISFRSLQYSFKGGLIYEGRHVSKETLKSFKRIFK